jgi:hypothetical protein
VHRQFRDVAARADLLYRDYHDFYAARTDMTTGRVSDSTGRSYDLTVIGNSDSLKRRYAGLTMQATYRRGARLNFGATYTLSRASGNVDGEGAGGPTASAALQYPEYKQPDWNYPDDDLSIDQRHRSRLWASYLVERVPGLTLSVLQTLESGVPYAAVTAAGVNPQPFVANPGYLTPPAGTATVYYYTAPDAFRTEGQRRTDLAATYSRALPGSRRIEAFGQVQVINLFNHYQLCGCGASTVFQNGGSVVVANRIDTAVRTSVTNPAVYQTFNPFTTVPQRGVNWDYGPNFAKALSRTAYTSPRTFRLTLGLRF